MSDASPRALPDPPPKMTTFGLALDSAGIIWQYQGSRGMVQIGTLTPALGKPVNTVLPHATGSTVVGNTITCDEGTWNPAGDNFTRQWQSGGTNISGATGTSYTTQVSDETHSITCIVTATNESGSTSATSNAVGPITAS